MASRYDELKQAISDYGEAAMSNLVRCKGLSRAIIDGFAEWYGCPPKCVSAVPPAGQFDPRRDYGDAAYSFHGAKVIRLEPIAFGLCVAVDNVEDSGMLWLRTAIRMDIAGNNFDVFVASQPMVKVPLEFSDNLVPVFEAIHRELMQVFRAELEEFKDERFDQGIGFYLE